MVGSARFEFEIEKTTYPEDNDRCAIVVERGVGSEGEVGGELTSMLLCHLGDVGAPGFFLTFDQELDADPELVEPVQ